MNVNLLQRAIATIAAFDASVSSSDPVRPPSTKQSLIQSLSQFEGGRIEATTFKEEFKRKFSQLEAGERLLMIGQLTQLTLGTGDSKTLQVHNTFLDLLASVKRELEDVTAMLTAPGEEKKYNDFSGAEDILRVQKEIKHVAELVNALKAPNKYDNIANLLEKDIMDPIFGGKLYLGPSNASRESNFEALHRQGVNHILIILDPTLAKSFRRTDQIQRAGFTVSVLALPDLDTESMNPVKVSVSSLEDLSTKSMNPDKLKQFKESLVVAFKFLDEGLKQGNGTAIHCNAGIHRSPAVLMAYLMKKFGVTFDEAQTYIQHMRPRATLAEGVKHAYREYLKSPDFQEFMRTINSQSGE